MLLDSNFETSSFSILVLKNAMNIYNAVTEQRQNL